VRRSVNVLRFGVAEPESFALAADLGLGLTTSGSRFSTLTVKGALSDFATLDARVDAPSWRRSFAQVTLQHGSLRVGGGWRDPFGLGLPGAFGIAGTWSGDGWGAAAALGHVSGDRFAGAVAGSWTADALSVAAGIGVVEGSPLLAVRAEHAVAERKVVASAGWDRGGGSLATRAELRDDDGTIDLRAEARGIGTDRLRLDVGVRYRFGDDVLYADGGWSQVGGPAWSGRAGGAFAITADLPGTLRLGMQLGVHESFAQLGHRIDVRGGWQAAHALGARVDGDGVGVTFDAGWTRSGADHLAFDARVAYRPTADRLTGRVGGRYQVELDAWTANASAGWDVGQRALGASAGLAWRDGAWRTEVDASVGYAWGAAAGRWTASATFTGGYAWRWPLPPAVSDAFGGRRVGAVRGRVVVVGADGPGGAEAVGLAGVIVEIGRYRVATDEDGAFAIDLPPGRYPAAVVAATVPVAVRLLDAPRTEVEVRLREVSEVAWQATRTTVLSGRVLEDRDGDGVADDPPRGVAARLLLTDAEGLRRVLVTDADGAFSARGLVRGEAELLLLDMPAGATVVGEERRTVRLAAGEAAVVEFLVQPLVVVARSFAAQALRIRGAAVEAERVPPGAAPLVRVEVQGDVRSVVVESAVGSVTLLRQDGVWVGRVGVPTDAPDGVWPFTLVARGVDGEAMRRGQLVVAGDATAVALASDGPVRPGGGLRLTLTAFLDVERVTVGSPFGEALQLEETEPGRWEAVLAVPSDAEDAIWTLDADVVSADGRGFTAQARFRVLAP
jgi:hypothetical protein